MSRYNPASTGPALDDAINALKGDLTAAPATSQLNSWIGILNGQGEGAQGAILEELNTLKTYISRGDTANISHAMHRVAVLVNKDAETVEDDELNSKLRRLGEALLAASNTLGQ